MIKDPDVLPQRGGLVNRRELIGRMTVRACRANVNEAIDPGPRRCLGECPRSIDAPELKLFPASPVTNLGRTVEDQGHIIERMLTRSRICEITALDFDPERVQERRSARRPD